VTIEEILSTNPAIEMTVFAKNQKAYHLSYLRLCLKLFRTKKLTIIPDNFIFINIKKNINIIFFFWFIMDLKLQKLIDYKIIPFLINFLNNIILFAKKK
jgi:hypothetical protein